MTDDWYLLLFPALIGLRARQLGLTRWDFLVLLGYSSLPLFAFGADRVLGKEEKLITAHHAFMAAVFIAVGFLWGWRRRDNG